MSERLWITATLSTAAASLLVCSCAYAAVEDSLIIDDINYINIEFSSNMKYAAMLEEVPDGADVRYKVWLPAVDAATLDLVPSDGQDNFAGYASFLGMPQWGRDDEGIFAVYLDEDKRFVIARPQESGPPLVTTVFDDGQTEAQRRQRAFPFPARASQPGSTWINYERRDNVNGTISAYAVDLREPSVHRLVHRESSVVPGRPAALIVNEPRWLAGTLSFLYGAYPPGCGVPPRECTGQLRFAAITGAGIRRVTVTSDTHSKIDAFPFRNVNGAVQMLAGLDGGPDGGLYRFDSASGEYLLETVIAWDFNQTDLLQPGGAQSFEPFLWRGEDYAVYQASDLAFGDPGSFPVDVPGEIWVVRLGVPDVRCRVSISDFPGDPGNPHKQTRIDAEPVVGNGRVALYYHASLPFGGNGPQPLDLRRIDLGDKAEFDESCRLGNAYPVGVEG